MTTAEMLRTLPAAIDRVLADAHDLLDPADREAALEACVRLAATVEELTPLLHDSARLLRDIERLGREAEEARARDERRARNRKPPAKGTPKTVGGLMSKTKVLSVHRLRRTARKQECHGSQVDKLAGGDCKACEGVGRRRIENPVPAEAI